MNRLGDQFLFQKFGVIGDEGRFFGNPRIGEIALDLAEFAFQGDDVFLQEVSDIAGDGLVDAAESGIGSFRNGENPVQVFQVGLGGFSRSGHSVSTWSG